MFKFNILYFIFPLIFIASCSNKEVRPAKKIDKVSYLTENKKQGFDPLKHGFSCDSLSAATILSGQQISKLIISIGRRVIDTLNILANKLTAGAEKDIIITDYNFDGFCDFVLPNVASAQNGGMDFYYYLYDNELLRYREIKSLPKVISEFKLDIKNQRVKIYCPYQDCFAYYQYNDKKQFELVQGEYKVTP